MKKFILSFALLFTMSNIFSQDNTVMLIVSGQGKNTEESRNNALHSAIEQAFGSYISSNTTILNDQVIKDEIVSVSNGNIQKYEIINETNLSNGYSATTLKVIVSINKLTTFCVSKGIKVEFEGGLFAANIKLQQLQEKNELISWKSTYDILMHIVEQSFEKEIKVLEPVLLTEDKWKISININFKTNKNFENILNQTFSFIKSISLSENEKDNYLKLGKSIYILSIPKGKKSLEAFYFRNKLVRDEIATIPWFIFSKLLYETNISNGVDTLNFRSKSIQNVSFNDLMTNPLLRTDYGDVFLFSYYHDAFKINKISKIEHGRGAEYFISPYPSFYDRQKLWHENDVSFLYGEPILPSKDLLNSPNSLIFNLTPITDFFNYNLNEIESLDYLKNIKSYSIINIPIQNVTEDDEKTKNKKRLESKFKRG
jgi:hypothetical protein